METKARFEKWFIERYGMNGQDFLRFCPDELEYFDPTTNVMWTAWKGCESSLENSVISHPRED